MGGSAVPSDNESGNNWVMASVWGASENFSVIEKCLCRLALQISKSIFPCVNVNVRSRLSRAVRSLSISFKIYFWALLCRPSLDTLHWSRQEGNNWTRPRLFRFSCQSQVMESSFNFFYTIWTALNPPYYYVFPRNITNCPSRMLDSNFKIKNARFNVDIENQKTSPEIPGFEDELFGMFDKYPAKSGTFAFCTFVSVTQENARHWLTCIGGRIHRNVFKVHQCWPSTLLRTFTVLNVIGGLWFLSIMFEFVQRAVGRVLISGAQFF